MSVSPYEINSTASAIYKMRTEVSDVKRDINGLVAGSSSYWTGKAANSFKDSGGEIVKKLSSLISLLDDLSSELRSLANAVDEADAARAAEKAKEAARLAEQAKQQAKQKAR